MSASIGLMLGVSIFVLGLKRLEGAGRAPAFASRYTRAWCIAGIYAAMIMSIFTIKSLLNLPEIANQLMIWVLLVVTIGVLFLAMKEEKAQRRRMLACLILVGLSIIFWAILFQMYFSVNLFSERIVDRTVFGFDLPTPVFIGLESFFIITLGPVLAWLWTWLDDRDLNPSTPMKFAIGLLFLVLTFGALLMGVHFQSAGLVSAWWLVLSYFFLATGELILSPVGLSMVTTLVPPRYVGMMMGVWFVALGLGAKLAGVIAGLSAVPAAKALRSSMSPTELEGLRLSELPMYGHGFFIYTLLALAVGLIALCLVPFIKRLMVENMAGGTL
jgi:POT family proton-dependent oligopeptide transporter